MNETVTAKLVSEITDKANRQGLSVKGVRVYTNSKDLPHVFLLADSSFVCHVAIF